MQPDKFYVVVRKDLGGFGYQSSQAMHAAIDYCMTHKPKDWWNMSNTIVVLVADSQEHLLELTKRALVDGVKSVTFCEPDLNYEATSLALEPGDKSKLICKGLPLLGKDVADWDRDLVRFSLIGLQNEFYQTETQTIMEHGYSINRYAMDLLQYLSNQDTSRYDWSGNVPEIMLLFGNEIVRHVRDIKDIWDYTIFHDCGKPICQQIVDGKYHFPNHAATSAMVAKRKGMNDVVCNLIKHDMDLHTIKAEEMPEFMSSVCTEDMITLLVVAFASLMSNAEQHGGTSADSYKIKSKKLTSRAKIIMSHVFSSKKGINF